MGEFASRILVVDDDSIVAESMAEFLRAEGYEAATALNAGEALESLAEAEKTPPASGQPIRPFSLVISDVSMPGTDGLALLREIKRRHRGVVVLMVTGYGTIESAVEAVRLGAVDYLTKPVVDDELRIALERALKQQALLAENQVLRQRLDGRLSLDNIVGTDPRMQRIYELVEAVAPSRTTVLMTGESGTGKSLIAHAIHHHSPRAGKPYVEISCGSIPETLLESELFGHVKGAFTGAHADKVGRFLAASGGTIFLDEINSASPGMQLKLLRVLQERKFEPVGSTQTIEVDVRVVLASNQPLEQLVASGQFRQDLYYRINVVKIELPPLRDRISDIPILAEHFLAKFARDLGKQIAGFSPEAMNALQRYQYPGNVRELQNVIERAAVLSRRPIISAEDLPPSVLGQAPELTLRRATNDEGEDLPWVPMPLEEALREPEKRILLRALKANHWNRQKTADQLGINRTTLYKKLKAHGLAGPDDRMAG
ncbi:MAG: sigma-54-dependent Fis family transcriptional regulator [Phycisphaerales bacterium]|jgi:DNA-binding NtrC family response regulator|nr:sigma-54-dependent Fis family transcriptional regulator [Phycisphaerales bacterium]